MYLTAVLLAILYAFIAYFKLINSGKCPPTQVCYPCSCDNKSQTIKCEANELYDLRQVFQNISHHLNASEKNFNYFILNNSVTEELSDNSFADITFRFINIIDARNLRRISAQAFRDTRTVVQVFDQSGDSRLEESLDELFVAINSLTNLLSLRLNIFNMISLPAFAFSNLNALQELILSDGQLNQISNDALYFSNTSDQTLFIDLQRNQLNELSVEMKALIDSKRPLDIDLRENRFTYLNETVYKRFFDVDKRNVINFRANPFNCDDCRMRWLVRDRLLYCDQLIDIRCATFVSIFERNIQDYFYCDLT